MYEMEPVGGTACRFWLYMPYLATSAARASQSAWVGTLIEEAASSSRHLSVVGAHSSSMYLRKNSPDAYAESSKPSKRSPRSRAIVHEALMASNRTVMKYMFVKSSASSDP